jgi:hypothetical protein
MRSAASGTVGKPIRSGYLPVDRVSEDAVASAFVASIARRAAWDIRESAHPAAEIRPHRPLTPALAKYIIFMIVATVGHPARCDGDIIRRFACGCIRR